MHMVGHELQGVKLYLRKPLAKGIPPLGHGLSERRGSKPCPQAAIARHRVLAHHRTQKRATPLDGQREEKEPTGRIVEVIASTKHRVLPQPAILIIVGL